MPPLRSVTGWLLTAVLTVGVGTAAAGAPRTDRVATPVTRPADTVTTVTVRGPAELDVSPLSAAVTTKAASLPIWKTPGGAPWLTLSNPTWKGFPLALPVLATRGRWLQVALAMRPNGTTGWVPAAEVRLFALHYRIEVIEHAHLLQLWHDGRLAGSWPVAVGRAQTPTPTGLFFIDALLPQGDPGGPYGPEIMGTSAFSDVYQSFDGGEALIGIHGTDEPWVIGTSASHGCVRLHDADAAYLSRIVPLGTPVQIVS